MSWQMVKAQGKKKNSQTFYIFPKAKESLAFVESSEEQLKVPIDFWHEPDLTQGYNHDEQASLTDQVMDADVVF